MLVNVRRPKYLAAFASEKHAQELRLTQSSRQIIGLTSAILCHLLLLIRVCCTRRIALVLKSHLNKKLHKNQREHRWETSAPILSGYATVRPTNWLEYIEEAKGKDPSRAADRNVIVLRVMPVEQKPGLNIYQRWEARKTRKIRGSFIFSEMSVRAKYWLICLESACFAESAWFELDNPPKAKWFLLSVYPP